MSRILVILNIVDQEEHIPPDIIEPKPTPTWWQEAYRNVLHQLYEHGVFFSETIKHLEEGTLGFTAKEIDVKISELESIYRNASTLFQVQPSLFYAMKISEKDNHPYTVMLTIMDPLQNIYYQEARAVDQIVRFPKTHQAVNQVLTEALSKYITSTVTNNLVDAEKTKEENKLQLQEQVKNIIQDTTLSLANISLDMSNLEENIKRIDEVNSEIQQKITETRQEIQNIFNNTFLNINNAINKLNEMIKNPAKKPPQPQTNAQQIREQQTNQSIQIIQNINVASNMNINKVQKSISNISSTLSKSIENTNKIEQSFADITKKIDEDLRRNLIIKKKAKQIIKNIETAKEKSKQITIATLDKQLKINIKKEPIVPSTQTDEMKTAFEKVNQSFERALKTIEQLQEQMKKSQQEQSKLETNKNYFKQAITNLVEKTRNVMSKVKEIATTNPINTIVDMMKTMKGYIEQLLTKKEETITKEKIEEIMKEDTTQKKDKDIRGPEL